MSTNSTALRLEAAGNVAEARPGFFARALHGLIEARKRHGEAHVRAYLSRLSDERLSDLGFSPDRVKAIRAKDGAANSYWL